MRSISAKLAGLLRKVERPGDFYAAGTAAIFPPQLGVEGVGVIALPLLDVQAEQLIAAAERAPYGRGSETVHDETVRRTWQIDASRVRIGGRHWQESLNAIAANAAAGLGVAEPVAACREIRERDARRFETPVFFILGRHDMQVVAGVAAAYFDEIEAPHKQLFWLEKSGHFLPFEEPAEFNRILIDVVRPFALEPQRPAL